jgi:hypothetical protein
MLDEHQPPTGGSACGAIAFRRAVDRIFLVFRNNKPHSALTGIVYGDRNAAVPEWRTQPAASGIWSAHYGEVEVRSAESCFEPHP